MTAAQYGQSATLRTTFTSTARGLAAIVEEEVYATGRYGFASAGPPQSAHETLLLLSAPVPTIARLVVTSTSSGTRTELGGWRPEPAAAVLTGAAHAG